MSESVEYFAYGSNLCKEQMKRRGITIEETMIAELPGWRLAFTIHSNAWKGGVADIIPDPKKKVEGIVYSIPNDDLKSLDYYEGRKVDDGIEIGMYRRQYLPVKKAEGWKTVLTYLVNRTIESKSTSDFKPSKEYLETIISGAEEHGLSEGYLNWLKNIECKD